MSQARSISYDDIITKILPLAQEIILKATDKKTNLDLSSVKRADDNTIQAIAKFVNEVKTVENLEKDPDKLIVLHDVNLLLNLLGWSAGLKQQSKESPFSFMYSISKCILWSKMPRFIVDNRNCVELANDILAKSELVKQKQSKLVPV